MKPQTKLNLSLALGGSGLLAPLAMIDPSISGRDVLCVVIGIWAFFAGLFVTQLLTTKPNEKDNP